MMESRLMLPYVNHHSKMGDQPVWFLRRYVISSLRPAHLLAEAISQLHGIRWSGPVTPSEMQYVEQYVFTKYPQYCNGLVDEGDIDPYYYEETLTTTPDGKRKPPSPSFGNNHPDIDKIKLESSRLLDLIETKSSNPGTFISIPEVQARNKVLKHFGLTEDDYQVLFTPRYKDAMMLVGESYPFFRGNFYLTIIQEELDCIREFATYKESKVISAPEIWMDLRIRGSQLCQYFRRKSNFSPKGLFSYPADVNGTRCSMHWTVEAHRNSWHVLLDATGIVLGGKQLDLTYHQPDFVLCTLDNTHAHPSKITCILARRKSIDTSSSIQSQE